MSRHLVPSSDSCKNILILAVACLGVSCSIARAQAVASPPPASDVSKTRADMSSLAFDVVSIRPSKSGELVRIGGEITQDQYRALDWPLGYTIGMAYFPRMLISEKRIQGAPGWVWDEEYDLVAKIAPEDVIEWQNLNEHPSPLLENKTVQAMLQKILADRCKLVVHRIPAEIPGYALEVGKHGLNLNHMKEAPTEEATPSGAIRNPAGGGMVPIMPGREPVLRFYQTSMTSLAARLSILLGVLVEDRTGLSGNYDFSLTRWVDSGSYSWDLDALGLKLERVNVPTETLIIDHIERPSPN